MNNLNEIIELGGMSMWAIIAVSIFGLAIVIAKLIQFLVRDYWFKKTPTKRDVLDAQSGLKGLEVVSVVAPLLGLLGTVIGMIQAFRDLESAGGSPEISLLAGGIWQALSTTAAGMVVAIFATIFLGLFDGTVERMARKIEAVQD